MAKLYEVCRGLRGTSVGRGERHRRWEGRSQEEDGMIIRNEVS